MPVRDGPLAAAGAVFAVRVVFGGFASLSGMRQIQEFFRVPETQTDAVGFVQVTATVISVVEDAGAEFAGLDAAHDLQLKWGGSDHSASISCASRFAAISQ